MKIHAGYGQPLLLADTQNVIPTTHMIPVACATANEDESVSFACVSQSNFKGYWQ